MNPISDHSHANVDDLQSNPLWTQDGYPIQDGHTYYWNSPDVTRSSCWVIVEKLPEPEDGAYPLDGTIICRQHDLTCVHATASQLARNRKQNGPWVIYSHSEEGNSTDRPAGYWNEAMGWVSLDEATRYTDDQLTRHLGTGVAMPLSMKRDARWLSVPLHVAEPDEFVLCVALNEFAARNGLELMCAQDMLYGDGLSSAQKCWLIQFGEKWELLPDQ